MAALTALAGHHPRAPSRSCRDDRGGSTVEYALLASGVAAVIALVVFVFGDNVADLFDDTCDVVASEASQTAC